MAAIGDYERELVTHLIDMLQRLPGVQIAGITDPARYTERVPTVIFGKADHTPLAIAQHLAAQHIYVWDGDYYAQEIMQRLGHGKAGLVRVGPVHYNTHEEIHRLQAALETL
jgi:selenocysteine lyase/cysteine desulfurase